VHMAFFIGGVIDVGIEVLPMKSLQTEMSSGVPYYEVCTISCGKGVPRPPCRWLSLVSPRRVSRPEG
jgi:hypothetical protein